MDLIHAGIHEWYGCITMRHNWTRPYEPMILFRCEIVQENTSNAIRR